MVWLFIAFLVVPVLEIFLITQVAGQIGWPLALLLVIGVSAVGAWLVRREGLGVINRVRATLGQGRMPTEDLADGAMIFFASALMLTPGFLTDALGLALLIPPIRAVLRPPVIAFFRRRIDVRVAGLGGTGFGGAGSGSPFDPFGRSGPSSGRRGDVVDIDDESIRRPDRNRPTIDGDDASDG